MTSDVCKVIMCATALKFVFRLLSMSDSCGCGRWWSKHWALAFRYGKERTIVFDATNLGGVLQGSKKYVPDDVFEKCYEEKDLIGMTTIKESVLDDILKEMSRLEDKAYHLIKNNCQIWAKVFLSRVRESAEIQDQSLYTRPLFHGLLSRRNLILEMSELDHSSESKRKQICTR